MRDEDARAFLEAHRASVRGLTAADYPREVIEAWAPLPISARDVERFLVNVDGEIRLVADLDGRVVGIGAVIPERCEVRACYVAPSAARAGVGAAIVAEIERIARQHGRAFLELDASVTAEPFYRSLGYAVVGRRDHALASGVRMASVQMRKDLAG
jgi:putative acetyltransferase